MNYVIENICLFVFLKCPQHCSLQHLPMANSSTPSSLSFLDGASTSSCDFPSVMRTPILRARGLMPAWVLKLCWRMKFKAMPSGIFKRESVTSLLIHMLNQKHELKEYQGILTHLWEYCLLCMVSLPQLAINFSYLCEHLTATLFWGLRCTEQGLK